MGFVQLGYKKAVYVLALSLLLVSMFGCALALPIMSEEETGPRVKRYPYSLTMCNKSDKKLTQGELVFPTGVTAPFGMSSCMSRFPQHSPIPKSVVFKWVWEGEELTDMHQVQVELKTKEGKKGIYIELTNDAIFSCVSRYRPKDVKNLYRTDLSISDQLK